LLYIPYKVNILEKIREQRMEKDIRVSVVMTAYNHKKYICQAVNSVLFQKTNFNYEVLVGDDASTDGTKDLLISNYKDNGKIKLFLRNQNVGGTKNIYNLFMHAKGQYLCACDGDDYWTDENYLQTMVDWMESHNGYAGVVARRIMLSEKTNRKVIKNAFEESNCDISIVDLMKGNKKFELCACLFLNFFHDGLSDYRLYKMSKNAGDLSICIHILQHGNVYQLENIIGVYRVDRIKGSTNYNSKTSNNERFLEYINILKYLEQLCYPELDYSFLQAHQAYMFLNHTAKKEKIKGIKLVIEKISFKAFIRLVNMYCLDFKAFYKRSR